MRTFRFVVFQADDGCAFRRQWLGVGYLASALQQLGIAVEAAYYSLDDLETAVRDTVASRARIVGLSLLHLNLSAVRTFVRLLRSTAGPDVHIVLGNVEAWGLGEKAFEFMPEIDSLVVGEGERTVVDLAGRVFEGRSLFDCAGLIWRQKSGVVMKNLPRSLDEDLDVLGPPNRSLTNSMGVRPYPFSIKGSRGCQSHCTFCECWVGRRHQPGPRVRSHSIEFLLDEMERAIRDDIRYISFEDDSFEDRGPDPATAFQQLHDAIKSRNLNARFVFNCRAESVTEASAAALGRLRGVGLDLVFIGLDAGNANDLKLYGKSACIADNYRATQLLREAGVALDYGFIMFNPFSTFATLRDNADFLERAGLDVDGPILQRRLEIYQGSAITTHIRNKGLLNPENEFVVVDSFGYRFVDKRMADVWSVLRELDNVPVHSDFLDLVKAFSRKLKDSSTIEQRDAELIQHVDYFRHESTSLWLSFFRATLDTAEEGRRGFEAKIRTEMRDVERRLTDIWTSVAASLRSWSLEELTAWGLDVLWGCWGPMRAPKRTLEDLTHAPTSVGS